MPPPPRPVLVPKRAAREDLILAHRELVEGIARRVHAKCPPQFCLSDLVGEGMLALVKAAAKYDPAHHGGTPFSAFCRQAVHGAMIESIRRKRWHENTRPSIDADADHDGVERSETARAVDRMAHQPDAPTRIDTYRMRAKIADASQYLAPDEREILRLVYAPDEPHIRTVAARMGLGVAECAMLHNRAVASLRARLTPGAAIPKAA